MIPPPFEYLSPNQLSEANFPRSQKHGEQQKSSWRHSLIPAMKLDLHCQNILLISAE
ncbi:MAG: hypothetical protein Ct9H300mP28_00750 [Pseudomonadota bacterium]|nr:MAG: hypothetical protein Ct9H300mP28_00750 [Pseudomonadota bacterium]